MALTSRLILYHYATVTIYSTWVSVKQRSKAVKHQAVKHACKDGREGPRNERIFRGAQQAETVTGAYQLGSKWKERTGETLRGALGCRSRWCANFRQKEHMAGTKARSRMYFEVFRNHWSASSGFYLCLWLFENKEWTA